MRDVRPPVAIEVGRFDRARAGGAREAEDPRLRVGGLDVVRGLERLRRIEGGEEVGQDAEVRGSLRRHRLVGVDLELRRRMRERAGTGEQERPDAVVRVVVRGLVLAAVRELAAEDRRDLTAGRVLAAVEEQEVETEGIARQSEHPAELAGADDADCHARPGASRGSGCASTPDVCCSR